ncbi:MAG: MlaE family ABC transporter permease [Alkalilacustris sp.]
MIAFLGATGRTVRITLAAVGAMVRFTALVLAAGLRGPFFGQEVLRQLATIGWQSLPVVGLTALFTGAALALQIHAGGARFNAESVVPSIVAIGITRELGPVMAGLMVAARVASSIAAEIGTMKVTEQIDALVTLSTDPMKYLAVPRVLAATLAVPVLVGVGDSLGILGGWLVGMSRLGFDPTTYLVTTAEFLRPWDVASGLIKGAAFGFIVAVTGCFFGMRSGQGAQGVGRATKRAVVTAAVLILGANYLLTEVFFRA